MRGIIAASVIALFAAAGCAGNRAQIPGVQALQSTNIDAAASPDLSESDISLVAQYPVPVGVFPYF